MGRAKYNMIEAQERGWWSSDKYVCKTCISEPFLSLKTEEFSSENNACSFCASIAATPIDYLMPYIMHGIYNNYNDPSSAGVPREDGDWVGDVEWIHYLVPR